MNDLVLFFWQTSTIILIHDFTNSGESVFFHGCDWLCIHIFNWKWICVLVCFNVFSLFLWMCIYVLMHIYFCAIVCDIMKIATLQVSCRKYAAMIEHDPRECICMKEWSKEWMRHLCKSKLFPKCNCTYVHFCKF